jgi:CheY-like chemotaxis protein
MKKLSGVLIVDDDITNNFLSEILIQEMNITDHIFTVYNGKDALTFIKSKYLDESNLLKNSCPELILLDINMPVMDGFEFLEEFEKIPNKSNNKIAIVMLTSSDDKRDVEKASQYSVAGYLNKPLTEDKINGILESITEKNH